MGPVLETAKTMAESIHLEVTNLIIPGKNDSVDQLEKLASWISSELGEHIPVHLSAYFPRYKLNAPPTSAEVLGKAAEIFRENCRYVYLGNVASHGGADTSCASCGALLIERAGYATKVIGLAAGGACAKCGAENNIVM